MWHQREDTRKREYYASVPKVSNLVLLFPESSNQAQSPREAASIHPPPCQLEVSGG